MIPRTKEAVPFSLGRRRKKDSVRVGPRRRMRPIRKRIWGVLGRGGVGGRKRGREWGIYVSHCEPGRGEEGLVN